MIDPVKDRRQVAYVMSEDAMYGTLTPEEVIAFSLDLRKKFTNAVRNQKVDDMLASLGISHCRSTFIGTELIKGISSGERKRASVGVDLVIDPQILFLDEPTTGLDSYRAFILIQMLKASAQQNSRCIVCTIHQPSSETFALFDDVMFLFKGAALYQGPVNELKDYFGSLGYDCPTNHNPSDFVMTLLQTACIETIEDLERAWQPHMERKRREIQGRRSLAKREKLPVIEPTDLTRQIKYLTVREMTLLFRDKKYLATRFMVPIFLALLTGGILWKAGQSGLSIAHIGAVTNIAILTMMAAVQPLILQFPLEKPIFIREHSSGMYDVSAFFFVKTICELPICALQVVIVLLIDYFMSALVGSFGLIYVGALLNAFAAGALAVCIGAFASSPRAAVEMQPLLFLPQFLFAGFFIRITTIPIVLQWIQWIVPLK